MKFNYTPSSNAIPLRVVAHKELPEDELIGEYTLPYKGANRLSSTRHASIGFNSAELVQNNATEIKQMYAQVGMYLDDELRDHIFSEIDELLNVEEFAEPSALINRRSFLSFLHFMVTNKGVKNPALTLGATGNLLSYWIEDHQRMSIEFFPFSVYRLIYSRPADGKRETMAYHGYLHQLRSYLDALGITVWKRDE